MIKVISILFRVVIIDFRKIMSIRLQHQYDKIYSFFKTTCEPFDFLEWDGRLLQIWQEEVVVERYYFKDLQKIISSFC